MKEKKRGKKIRIKVRGMSEKKLTKEGEEGRR